MYDWGDRLTDWILNLILLVGGVICAAKVVSVFFR